MLAPVVERANLITICRRRPLVFQEVATLQVIIIFRGGQKEEGRDGEREMIEVEKHHNEDVECGGVLSIYDLRRSPYSF